MTKTLTIELALCHTNTQTGVSLRQWNAHPSKRVVKRNSKQYDVIILSHDIPEDVCPSHYQEAFFESLSLSDERRDLLRWVVLHLSEYLTGDSFVDKVCGYDIATSYAHFAFNDELEKTTFSAPHITSPVLFDPNDVEVSYRLSSGIASNSLIVKRTNAEIIKYESDRRSRYERQSMITRPTTEYKTINIVNSLLDFSENLAYRIGRVNLKSIYEERNSAVSLPSISSISTYELQSFIFSQVDPRSNPELY